MFADLLSSIDGFIPRSKARRVNYGPEDPASLPDPASSEDQQPESKPKRSLWRKLWLSLLILLTLSVLLVYLGYYLVKSVPLKGEAAGRVNILVMGVDDAARLSDTLMLVSIDTRNQEDYQVAMVSIPRDLQAEIPEFGEAKINSAYSYGQNGDYPGGGAALTKKTVEQTFDLTVHYYLAVDFTGFERAINAVEGVDVTVKEDIYDPYYPDGSGGYDLYEIEAGKRHLNGAEALKYTRSRQTTTDFDRAARQQQVLVALKDKLLSTDTIFDQSDIRQLLDVNQDHIHTDLGVREMLKMADWSRQFDQGDQIQHVLSDDPKSFLEATGFNGYVLTPRTGDFEEINQYIKNIFDSPEAKPSDSFEL